MNSFNCNLNLISQITCNSLKVVVLEFSSFDFSGGCLVLGFLCFLFSFFFFWHLQQKHVDPGDRDKHLIQIFLFTE